MKKSKEYKFPQHIDEGFDLLIQYVKYGQRNEITFNSTFKILKDLLNRDQEFDYWLKQKIKEVVEEDKK